MTPWPAAWANVRRTDFVHNPNSSLFHGFVGLEYYDRAVAHIAKNISRPVFFVFSDDIQWCQDHIHLEHPTHIVSHQFAGNKFGAYFKLMSMCKDFIIPNSSFGWWAAWLCTNREKQIIAPKRWYLDPVLNDQTSDLIPSGWLRM